MSDTSNISRRQVVLGSATAALLAGCSPQAEEKAPLITAKDGKPNLYKTLEQYEFKGQDGKKVDMKHLEATNRNKRATLSFGFDGCSIFCPPNNLALSELGKTDKNMVHYIVNVDPDKMITNSADPVQQRIAQTLRDSYMEYMIKAGINPKQVVVLYPKDTKTANDIPAKLGFTPPPKDSGPDSHYASIALYEKGGKYMDRKLAADAPKTWTRTLKEGVAR